MGWCFHILKVRGPDARFQDIMSLIYNEYKIDQGYSYDIIGKSSSLKGVLEPFSTQGNIDLAKREVLKYNRYLNMFVLKVL